MPCIGRGYYEATKCCMRPTAEIMDNFHKSDIRPLPTPAAYRQINPAVLSVPTLSKRARFLQRKRVLIGFAVAVALHAGLVLAWLLTPPLRLKASYAPERWVRILPIVAYAAPPPVIPAPAAVPEPAPAIATGKPKTQDPQGAESRLASPVFIISPRSFPAPR